MGTAAKKQSRNSEISAYCEGCRARVDKAIDAHWQIANVWHVQKQSLKHDIWRLPLNCLWAIPYMSLKKAAESLDKMGWPQWIESLNYVPSGFKVSVQHHIEKIIEEEVFELDQNKSATVERELKKYALGRDVIANFATSMSTVFLGWLIFGKGDLSLVGLIQQLSEYFARDRAASNFAFGKSFGRAFYGVVKPEITFTDMILSACVFTIFLTLAAFATSMLYAPVRRLLGLEKKKLNRMIDEIENQLILETHKK